jgi:hypothetical protein
MSAGLSKGPAIILRSIPAAFVQTFPKFASANLRSRLAGSLEHARGAQGRVNPWQLRFVRDDLELIDAVRF